MKQDRLARLRLVLVLSGATAHCDKTWDLVDKNWSAIQAS